MYAIGVSQYGQMTEGSWTYIGPQGIVHGTTLTILNAARKYLHSPNMKGKVYISSGLGGMSGAQGKAGVICGAITVLAEVDSAPLNKRFSQGWITEISTDVKQCVDRIKECRAKQLTVAIGFHGNIVTLWEALADEDELLCELASDQTSLHNVDNGGYYPVQLSFDESQKLIVEDPKKFKHLVQLSLVRHVAAINKLVAKGMHFWDYGNCFLLEASRAGADIMLDQKRFKYPSYIQEFLGDIFSLGFGPFRWICASGDPKDLEITDKIAAQVMNEQLQSHPPAEVVAQIEDNLMWVIDAGKNNMVVGSQARILYADAEGRCAIAAAFNKAIQNGKLKGPVVLSRDHHDVSGTDSPFRETSNVYDGSSFCADMAMQNVIGDSFRGATWVSIHNGGGVGWGEVINGGFGLLLDGTIESHYRSQSMLHWDVNNGIARRAWAGNSNANLAIDRAMLQNSSLLVTKAIPVNEDVLNALFKS
jgi:urocanate hydratase